MQEQLLGLKQNNGSGVFRVSPTAAHIQQIDKHDCEFGDDRLISSRVAGIFFSLIKNRKRLKKNITYHFF